MARTKQTARKSTPAKTGAERVKEHRKKRRQNY